MNPNLCRVVLRPRGVLEVFDLGWRLIRETWRAQVRLLAVVWLLPALACVPVTWLADGSPWLLAIPLLLGPAIQAPVTLLTGRLLFDPEVRVRPVLGEALRRVAPLAASWVVAALALVGGVATCGVGLLPSQGAILYLPEAVLLERVDVGRGVRRSLRLASGHAGIAAFGVAARYGVAAWCGLVGEYGMQALFTLVLQLGEPFGALTRGDVTPFLLGGLLLSHPLFAVYRLLLYVDVRTRNEGWDLQVGLRAAGMNR